MRRLVCHVSGSGRRHRTVSRCGPPFGSLLGHRWTLTIWALFLSRVSVLLVCYVSYPGPFVLGYQDLFLIFFLFFPFFFFPFSFFFSLSLQYLKNAARQTFLEHSGCRPRAPRLVNLDCEPRTISRMYLRRSCVTYKFHNSPVSLAIVASGTLQRPPPNLENSMVARNTDIPFAKSHHVSNYLGTAKTRLFQNEPPSYQGNFGPKRGGANSKAEKMANVGIWILRECLFVYVEHNNELERGLWGRDVWFVTEVIYQLCVGKI